MLVDDQVYLVLVLTRKYNKIIEGRMEGTFFFCFTQFLAVAHYSIHTVRHRYYLLVAHVVVRHG